MWLSNYLSIHEIWYMKRKKIKIALLFALFICFLVISFQFIYLVWKYRNQKSSQLNTLENTADMLTQHINVVCKHSNCNEDELEKELKDGFSRGRMHRGMMDHQPPNQPRILDRNEFVLFSKDFEFSVVSFQNPDLEIFLKEKTKTSWIDSWWDFFEYEWIDFLYKLKDFDHNSFEKILVFEDSELTKENFLSEFIVYLLLTVWIGIILFFVSYYFVSITLKPVEENISNMQQFVHNAGHELKTPLSTTKSTLQLARKTWDYSEAIEEASFELEKMNSLIDSLIQLSAIKKDNNIKEFGVLEIVTQIVNNYKEQAEKKNIKINLYQKENFFIKANPDYFRIFVSNLLSNAIKYSTAWSSVDIIVSVKCIEISDKWEGISYENKEKIFERFFKASETRENDGFWIGLSLVKKISSIYGRNIQVDSEVGKWTTFCIYF